MEVPLVLSGMVIDDLAGVLYPLYQVAEKILYPKETLEKVFSWHIRSAEISQMVGFLVLGYVFTYVLGSPSGFRMGFLAIGVCSFILAAYILLFLPELGKEQISAGEKKKFKVDKEFRLILIFEGLLVLGWSLAPEIVLINYILKVLHGTFFQIMLIMAGTSLASIFATYLSENIPRERGAIPLFSGYLMVAVQYGIMTMAPSFLLSLLAYALGRFGESLAFPFHRSWIFKKVPEEKASEIFSALSVYRKGVSIVSPAIAGALAYLIPTLPYAVSLVAIVVGSFIGLLSFTPSRRFPEVLGISESQSLQIFPQSLSRRRFRISS